MAKRGAGTVRGAVGTILGLALAGFGAVGFAQEALLTVERLPVTDYRPVVARVEAGDMTSARSRLQGVVTRLSIDEGDLVRQGQVVAVVSDDTLPSQISALGSRIDAAKSEVRQLEADLARAETLAAQGFYARARLEELKTTLDVARQRLGASEAEKRALEARRNEGDIRAPTNARVTEVRVVQGSVVSPGEVLANFATLEGVVRLSLPERHAGQLAEGATITLRLPSRDGEIRTASVVKIYPELRDGAVIADAVVAGGLSALVGERVDVLAAVGERLAIRVPKAYVTTRFGVDFVRVRVGERFIEAPVALASTQADAEGRLEVLSGLRPGDVIALPVARGTGVSGEG